MPEVKFELNRELLHEVNVFVPRRSYSNRVSVGVITAIERTTSQSTLAAQALEVDQVQDVAFLRGLEKARQGVGEARQE